MTWQPTKILRQTGSVPSSTGPAIVMTDEGLAVIKTLGNPEGPHALAREWIVTRLASWFGLQTFDIAQLMITDFEEITNGVDKRLAEPGMAVATRFEIGENWDGKSTKLSLLENPEDISKIVVFDTWGRNRDRHRPPNRQNLGNVFLSEENAGTGRLEIKAIDSLPSEWCVQPNAIDSPVHFLLHRASFLSQLVSEKLIKAVQQNLEGFEE